MTMGKDFVASKGEVLMDKNSKDGCPFSVAFSVAFSVFLVF